MLVAAGGLCYRIGASTIYGKPGPVSQRPRPLLLCAFSGALMPYCSTCGSQYSLGTNRCEHCGQPLPVPPLTTSKTDEPVRDIRLRRALAGVVDLSLATMLWAVLFRILVARLTIQTRVSMLIVAVGAVLLPAAYLVLRDALGGKSIGKLLTGLTVVNPKHRRRAGITDSFMRNLVFGFAVVPPAAFVVAAIAGVSILAGKPTRIGEGLTDARVMDDKSAEAQL